jgi:hypothetical protein
VTEDQPKITDRIITWAAGQPFNNVLLLLILFGGAWIVTTAVPQHLTQIQKGYESLTESHRDERERTQQLYDKWMNRTHIDADRGSKIATFPGDK